MSKFLDEYMERLREDAKHTPWGTPITWDGLESPPMGDMQVVYAVGNKEYSSKSEALAEMSRSMGMIVMGGDWIDVTTFEDAANGRQIYRLLAKIPPPTPDDTQEVDAVRSADS